MNEARDVYEKGMNAECGPAQPAVPSGDVSDLHRKYLDSARAAFTNKRTMATQEEVNKHLEILNQVIIINFICIFKFYFLGSILRGK